jgi:hypothetical protein
VPLWAAAVQGLTTFWNSRSAQAVPADASADSTWLHVASKHLSGLSAGVLNNIIPRWTDSQLKQAPPAGAQAPVIELCLIFSIAWALRGFQTALPDPAAEEQLEREICAALETVGFTKFPTRQSLWESCIDPVNVIWTPWASGSPLKLGMPIPESPSLAHPRHSPAHLLIPTTTTLSQHALIGFIAVSGGSAMVLATRQHELLALRYAVQHCEPVVLRSEAVQRLSSTCCAAMKPSHLWVCSVCYDVKF